MSKEGLIRPKVGKVLESSEDFLLYSPSKNAKVEGECSCRGKREVFNTCVDYKNSRSGCLIKMTFICMQCKKEMRVSEFVSGYKVAEVEFVGNCPLILLKKINGVS